MEPKKYTTIIHGKANRIRHALIYAVLEWTLIFFLLLNSLFSYLILKFALYFGLKPPCPLCSRLDHIFFKPHNSEPFYRSLICEQHSVELSKSGYCSIHRKLVESHDMCVDCSDSSFSDKQLMCSCCGASTKPANSVVEPCLVITQKRDFVGDFDLDQAKEGSLVSNAAIRGAYENETILPQHLEFYIDNDDYGLIPVELLNLGHEVGSHGWREMDGELVYEPVDGKHNSDSFCLDFLKFDEPDAVVRFGETKTGALAILNGAMEKLNEEVAATVKSNEAKVETLATTNGAEEEENEDVAVTMEFDAAKVETLPSINGAEEEMNEEADDIMKSDVANVETLATLSGLEEELNEVVVATLKLDVAKIETLANIIGPDEELNEKIAATMISDEVKVESLAIINGPEEDSNEEVAATVRSDEAKIETSATISGPQEGLSEEIAAATKSDEAKIEPLATISGPEEDGNEEFAGTMNSEEGLNEEVAAVMMSDEVKIETLATINAPEEDFDGEMDCTVKSDEVKVETLATKNGPEEALNEEIGGTMISDEVKIEDLVIEVETKEEVDSDDGSKYEIIPTTQEQAKETKREIYLEASVDQERCVSLTNSDDDHVTEMKEVNVLIRDSVALYHKESNEVSIENGMVDSIESSTSNAVCGATNGTCVLLENGHYDGSKKTDGDERDTEKENGLDEVEEERIPESPTSIHSFHLLQTRLLSIGRNKTPSEGSLDENVVNDNGYSNEEETMEELKSKLRAERKAFNVLYEELEEERNAAAISASQTMAMINRLQEEKAVIEMEALQYHRMMEEQAEYDHEALQLMNDILVKREKEKEELERELEACMNKLMAYEEKDRSFSVSCSNEVEVDAIVNMKDSLSCFEEERISILEQLKVLEENLSALADEEEHQIRNLNSFEQIYTNGEHHQEREMNGSKALVSENEFFDEDGGYRLDPFLLDGLPLAQFGSEKRRFTIEEEVERLYERLNALEEDKEFIKNCLGSLKKGDRGIHLLQEILQHLRDLKSAEFRARNVC